MKSIIKKTATGVLLLVCVLCAAAAQAAGPQAAAAAVIPSTDPRYKFSIDSFYREPLENPVGIFVDRAHGEVYVADRDKSEVFVFGRDGTPLFRFGTRDTLSGITDLVVRDDGIYVSREGKPYIDVFNLRGDHKKRLDAPAPEFLAGNMALGGDGNIYIVNKKLGECLVLDREDRFAGTIGSGLTSMSGVAVGGGLVYFVTPFYTGYVMHVYTVSGEHVMSFEGIEGQGGTLGLPVSVVVDGAGNMWVADSIKGVVIYDKKARKINAFGWMGPPEERLVFPVDIDFDSDGMIYIIDRDKKRISVFK